MPFENIVGKAQIIFFSVYEGERAWEFWRWPVSVRWRQAVHDRPMSRSKAKDRAALEEPDRLQIRRQGAAGARAHAYFGALGRPHNRADSYQRLEFLGDHVLGLVISDMLYRAFPKANEGELSRRLADLVRKETCAEVARAMDLGPALKLGNSESHAGGRLRTTILADACEALVGRGVHRRRL